MKSNSAKDIKDRMIPIETWCLEDTLKELIECVKENTDVLEELQSNLVYELQCISRKIKC